MLSPSCNEAHKEVHSFGVRNLNGDLPLRAKDHMRIASAAKAFSGPWRSRW